MLALLLAPMALLTAGLAPFVGRLVDRMHPRVLASFGLLCFSLGLAWIGLELDSDTATLGFAAATGVESIDNLGIGLNWHLTRNVKVALNYNQTDFSNFSGPDREKEKSIFTRLQLAF